MPRSRAPLVVDASQPAAWSFLAESLAAPPATAVTRYWTAQNFMKSSQSKERCSQQGTRRPCGQRRRRCLPPVASLELRPAKRPGLARGGIDHPTARQRARRRAGLPQARRVHARRSLAAAGVFACRVGFHSSRASLRTRLTQHRNALFGHHLARAKSLSYFGGPARQQHTPSWSSLGSRLPCRCLRPAVGL
jgi:hypothetical protein